MRRAIAVFRRRGAALAEVAHNPGLMRVELGWGAFFLVEWTSLVALSVWAYDEGGATAVGALGLVRLLPAALALPFGSTIADRFPRHRVLTAVYAAQAGALAATAVAISVDAPVPAIYALVAGTAVLGAPCRPAQLALLPLLARSPAELVAANVTAGTLEGIATLLGPLAAGVALLVASSSVALAGAALVAAVASLFVRGIRLTTDPSRATRSREETPLGSLLGGVHELAREREPAVVVACFVVQLGVRGALTVLLVSLSFDELGTGSAGVGWLSAAIGAGGLAGAVVAAGLTGRRRLATPFALALVLWGLPIAAVGVVPTPAVSLVALAVVGFGNTLLDVSGFTMLQRLGDDRVLGRVFGVLYTFGIGLGGLAALATPVLIDAMGLRGALVATGAVLPATALLAAPGLRAADRRAVVPADRLDPIARLPLFAPLPPTTLEKVAMRAQVEEATAGTVVIHEGAIGDRFYIVTEGSVDVATGGEPLRSLGAGDYFGEIALLHDVPRTATVTASSDTRFVTLTRDQFLAALAGNENAAAVAEHVSRDRLARSDRYH